jgi:hypothetical protein
VLRKVVFGLIGVRGRGDEEHGRAFMKPLNLVG